MSNVPKPFEALSIQLAWSSPKRNPPISAIRCTDGSWYIALLGSTGTWVFQWQFNKVGQPIGGGALIDGNGLLTVGADNTVQLWGLNQSQIVFVNIGQLTSAYAPLSTFTPHPVALALYPGAIPDEIINSKRCNDGSWYVATFLKGGSNPNAQGVWVLRWENSTLSGQPLFTSPLTPGHGWLEVGEDDTAQLWVLQKSPQGVNEILVLDLGSLASAIQPTGQPFSGKSIMVDLPLDPGAELYDYVSAIRCSDGSWYVSVFVVNHGNPARQGTWVFRWSNGQPGTPVVNGAVLPNAATLALGENNTVQLWGVGGDDGPSVMVVNIGPSS